MKKMILLVLIFATTNALSMLQTNNTPRVIHEFSEKDFKNSVNNKNVSILSFMQNSKGQVVAQALVFSANKTPNTQSNDMPEYMQPLDLNASRDDQKFPNLNTPQTSQKKKKLISHSTYDAYNNYEGQAYSGRVAATPKNSSVSRNQEKKEIAETHRASVSHDECRIQNFVVKELGQLKKGQQIKSNIAQPEITTLAEKLTQQYKTAANLPRINGLTVFKIHTYVQDYISNLQAEDTKHCCCTIS